MRQTAQSQVTARVNEFNPIWKSTNYQPCFNMFVKPLKLTELTTRLVISKRNEVEAVKTIELRRKLDLIQSSLYDLILASS